MSDIIKTSLKELSADLNIIQKKREIMLKKFDLESKSQILTEIFVVKDRAKKTVNLIFLKMIF
jgi:hypothetical protein